MALSVFLQAFSVLGLMPSHFGTFRTVQGLKLTLISIQSGFIQSGSFLIWGWRKLQIGNDSNGSCFVSSDGSDHVQNTMVVLNCGIEICTFLKILKP